MELFVICHLKFALFTINDTKRKNNTEQFFFSFRTHFLSFSTKVIKLINQLIHCAVVVVFFAVNAILLIPIRYFKSPLNLSYKVPS